MRFLADDSLRVLDNGHVLVGGSPIRIMRLSARGRELVEGVLSGTAEPESPAAVGLFRHLVDVGMFHPVPPEEGFRGSVSFVIPTVSRDVSALVQLLPADADVLVVEDAERAGPAVARNIGWRGASGDVVVFLDDDCVPTAGWLAQLLAHFADPAVVAVAPRVIAVDASDVLGRYEEARSPLDLGAQPAPVVAGTRVSYVPSAALAVRRSALADLGGFDESLRFGEDVDLVWRLHAAGGSVRYEPGSVVEHPPRPTIGSWLRQRFDYGTSAAPLAKRHPGALAPLRVSPWSLLAWALVAAGRAPLGIAVAAGTTAMLPRKLTMLRDPWPEALRLAGLGHFFAARQIADALIRAWWPVALGAALVSRHARRAVLAAVTAPHLIEWAQRRPALDPLRWVAMRVLDDVAYGAGVWAGCWRERTIDPLVPRSPSLFTLSGRDPVAEDDRRHEEHAADPDRPHDDPHE